MHARIPSLVITGASGAGKSALIARLLMQRAASERWAVLQNDFGASSLSGAPGVAEGAVTVRQVGGCICCSGRVALRTGLIALVRASRPCRLLIEAAALAEPAATLAVLAEPGIACALDVKSAVCVVAPRQLEAERHAGSEIYRRQIETADVVVLAGSSEAENRGARATLARLMKPEAQLFERAHVALSALERR